MYGVEIPSSGNESIIPENYAVIWKHVANNVIDCLIIKKSKVEGDNAIDFLKYVEGKIFYNRTKQYDIYKIVKSNDKMKYDYVLIKENYKTLKEAKKELLLYLLKNN